MHAKAKTELMGLTDPLSLVYQMYQYIVGLAVVLMNMCNFQSMPAGITRFDPDIPVTSRDLYSRNKAFNSAHLSGLKVCY